MAIQNRRGFYDKFDPSRLVAGEWAIVLDGDKNAPDGKSAYVCFAAGTVKRVALFEDMSTNIKKANKELVEELTAATNSATQKATETTEKCENTIKKSEETTAATIAAKEDCIQATQACKTSTEQAQSATQETKDATSACNAATSESKASTQTATETLEKLNTSENERTAAEKVRVENENTRISNEQKRVSDESERASAEQTRKSNEDERLTHENTRLDAEKVRVESENTRVESEKARTSAEQTRVQTETERINNEKMRVYNENARKNEEETRINNEKARIEKEDNRLTDEEKRVSAEKERAEKENARISAEETRVSNESARVDEENSRKLRFKEMIDAAQNVKFKVLEDNQVNEKGVPTIEGTAGVIYLVKDKKSSDTNHYIEWFYYNNKWEIFGTTNATMDAVPANLISYICNHGIDKTDTMIEIGVLDFKFNNTRVLKEDGAKILCEKLFRNNIEQNKNNNATLRAIDNNKTEIKQLKDNKADKTELTTKADKTEVEQLKKDKADKTDVDQLKEVKADKSALETLDKNKADKSALETLDKQIKKNGDDIRKNGKKTYTALKIQNNGLLYDTCYVYITIEPKFVTIKIYINVKNIGILQSCYDDLSINIISSYFHTLYNLLQPNQTYITGTITGTIDKNVIHPYNFINSSTNVIKWVTTIKPLTEKDTIFYEITYPTKNTNVIDETTLNAVNKDLKSMMENIDLTNIVAGAEAFLA